MPKTTQSANLSLFVGQQLRSRRRELGLTQAQVAARLGLSASYMQKLESGKDNLTIGQLEKIVAAYEATVAMVLFPYERLADLPSPEESTEVVVVPSNHDPTAPDPAPARVTIS